MRPYQQEAITAIVEGLQARGRGQLHAACGSGKTFMALRVVENLVPESGVIVVLAPSLALVGQILREWRSGSTIDFRAMAVCSDEKVADAPTRATDLPVPVATDPAAIASWLGHGGRRVIVGTYASADRVGQALNRAEVEADVLVCDEGHHLFGSRDAARRRIVTDSAFLPHRRRLVMTATPDVAGWRTADALSWRDEELFGPVLYRYPFSRGISEGYLKDYRLLVVGVSDVEARALLADTASDYVDGQIGLRTVVAHAALAHARLEYGTERAITFHPRVQQAVDFARTLPATLARLPADKRPGGPVDATYVTGTMNARERDAVLDRLATPPVGGWTVVANAQCLTEGVDVPAVNTVAFTHPSRSVAKVTQAVGRALRRSPGITDTANIIVPIVVPDATTEIDDLDPGDFEVVFEVVRALRAHDQDFANQLDRERWSQAPNAAGDRHERAPGVPGRITFRLPTGTSDRILTQLRLLTVRNSTSSWWDGYAEAHAYHREHGHLNVPRSHKNDNGSRLGAWIRTCRDHRRRGWMPPERIDALDRIGMVWEPRDAQRQQLLAACDRYLQHKKDLDSVPVGYVDAGGFRLGMALSHLRSLVKGFVKGRDGTPRTLDPDLRVELERRGMTMGPRGTTMDDDLKQLLIEKVRAGALLKDAGDALGLTRHIIVGARRADPEFDTRLDAARRTHYKILNESQKQAFAERVAAGNSIAQTATALGVSPFAVKATRRTDTRFDALLDTAVRAQRPKLTTREKQIVIEHVAAGNSIRSVEALGLSRSAVATTRRADTAFDSALITASNGRIRPMNKPGAHDASGNTSPP
ncbi:Helicase associated domain protein (plasmid) [Embleya sp. NBC_00888]|uniref:DEAD/DEAH box helicase n=1 Tax=Embleya sp. NBC_00888 TaxID=2975960 RepID=UPI002F91B980|nr:Helicase associated domain protein [Embleya sp. NBC_00888]